VERVWEDEVGRRKVEMRKWRRGSVGRKRGGGSGEEEVGRRKCGGGNGDEEM
jgi:hypothetical protein